MVTAVTLGILRVLNGQYLPPAEASDEYRPKRRTAKGLVLSAEADRKDLAAYVSLSRFTCQRTCALQMELQRYTHRHLRTHDLIDHSVFTSQKVRVNAPTELRLRSTHLRRS